MFVFEFLAGEKEPGKPLRCVSGKIYRFASALLLLAVHY